MTGTSIADIFTANVVQNVLGGQVNTLGSGDTLHGGGGVDTLNAKITVGAFVDGSGSYTMPIQPETTSVEIVNLQAVNVDIGSGYYAIADGNSSGYYTNVFVNAKDMLGVTHISSVHSDANLVIQNLTTQDDSGAARPVSGKAYRVLLKGMGEKVQMTLDEANQFIDAVQQAKTETRSFVGEDREELLRMLEHCRQRILQSISR